MLPTMLTKALALAFLVGQAIAEENPGSYIPYADSGCTKAIPDSTYDLSDLATGVEKWRIRKGYPAFTQFKQAHFPSAKSAVGGSGKQVWWKLAKAPDTQCRIVMMQRYSQLSYGDADPKQPPGNIFITAGMGTTGCFFSQLRDGVDLMTTYCCGKADCEQLSMGNGALYRRDEAGNFSFIEGSVEAAPETHSRVGSAVARAADMVAKEEARRDLDDVVASTSLIEERATVFNPKEWTKCKVSKNQGAHTSAGKQTIIGNVQTCTSPPCTFAVSQSIDSSTTLTRSRSVTITNGFDASVSFSGGITWPVKAETTVSAGYHFSAAIATDTGTSMTNGRSTTVSNTFGLQIGTTGFATFTPTLRCFTVEVDCGGGSTNGWHQCNPVFNSDGKTLQGDYNVVYIG
ncbi:uncharacterized protein BP5553_05610 [Venustampulla echinocandica]|uniref:Uncharacterized protein n=1 Tax=Venustampulla echinocandica TaxID=2656787 RepID=A0A370TRL5_9HELO|nr:uncharacterized protein BP5553_05610 [Venustampulla echinocandica]RDL38177.1 hypothetical protein BP5553_05610 [Venustampulla echinocandica]